LLAPTAVAGLADAATLVVAPSGPSAAVYVAGAAVAVVVPLQIELLGAEVL
jgi:hypothetical protein